MKALSVIIVTYNSEPDIYGCLDALLTHNDLGEALEIIVVDNASTSFERMHTEIQRLYGNRITVLSNTRNGGYGQGNNLGITHATAPVIMIMNPDVRWQEGSFKAITEAYQKDEQLAICGFRQVVNENGKRGISFSLLNHYNGLIRLLGGIIAKRLDLFCWRHMYFCGACFCVRKSIMEQIGLFDEHIFLYGEENDIHYRIHSAFPKTHDRYLAKMVYLHPTDDRPTTNQERQLRIQSNEYVMHKQGRAEGTYIRSEQQRLKWQKRLFKHAG